jgi:hypothetical protein
MKCQADLFQIVNARNPPGGLARRLNGREQQCDQDGDDRDHDQELDQRESSMHAQLRARRRGPTANGPTRGKMQRHEKLLYPRASGVSSRPSA